MTTRFSLPDDSRPRRVSFLRKLFRRSRSVDEHFTSARALLREAERTDWDAELRVLTNPKPKDRP